MLCRNGLDFCLCNAQNLFLVSDSAPSESFGRKGWAYLVNRLSQRVRKMGRWITGRCARFSSATFFFSQGKNWRKESDNSFTSTNNRVKYGVMWSPQRASLRYGKNPPVKRCWGEIPFNNSGRQVWKSPVWNLALCIRTSFLSIFIYLYTTFGFFWKWKKRSGTCCWPPEVSGRDWK